jgi:hypothetical protein
MEPSLSPADSRDTMLFECEVYREAQVNWNILAVELFEALNNNNALLGKIKLFSIDDLQSEI